MSDNPLNGQQLQAVQKQAQDALKVAVESMQLRKWAVEQAFSITTSLNSLPRPVERHIQSPTTSAVETAPPSTLQIYDPMKLAEAVYAFVSQAAVVRVDVTGGGK